MSIPSGKQAPHELLGPVGHHGGTARSHQGGRGRRRTPRVGEHPARRATSAPGGGRRMSRLRSVTARPVGRRGGAGHGQTAERDCARRRRTRPVRAPRAPAPGPRHRETRPRPWRRPGSDATTAVRSTVGAGLASRRPRQRLVGVSPQDRGEALPRGCAAPTRRRPASLRRRPSVPAPRSSRAEVELHVADERDHLGVAPHLVLVLGEVLAELRRLLGRRGRRWRRGCRRSLTSLAAVFSPTPGTPGRLSEVSPRNAASVG